jgi:uncharacterized membrane protein (UPF0136 family)
VAASPLEPAGGMAGRLRAAASSLLISGTVSGARPASAGGSASGLVAYWAGLASFRRKSPFVPYVISDLITFLGQQVEQL